MIEANIIQEDFSQSKFLSPAFFVPKPGTKKLRFVCDFREANRWIKRTKRHFPSVKDIQNSISKDTNYAVKLDILHAYQQLQLEKQSQDFTVFQLGQKRYRFLRGAMGLSSTSDSFIEAEYPR